MTEKTVVIQGTTFTIKRHTLAERKEIQKKVEESKDPNDYTVYSIYYGVKEPAFKDIKEVLAMEGAMADELLTEIISFNMPSEAFLTKLKSLSEQARPISGSLAQLKQ